MCVCVFVSLLSPAASWCSSCWVVGLKRCKVASISNLFCIFSLSACVVRTNRANKIAHICVEHLPLFPLCAPAVLFGETIFLCFCMELKRCTVLPGGVWMLHRSTDGWFPPFFPDSYIDGCSIVGEARETPRHMKQITAAQPSSAVSLGGDCTGNPAEMKWMQSYTQTNSYARACTRTSICVHIHTSTPLTNQSAPYCFWPKRTILNTHTHTVEYALAALHLYILYCSSSSRTVSPKAQTCLNALRVFHRLSPYLIYSLRINTNRVDKCIDAGTNARLCVTFYWTLPKLFLANPSYHSGVCTVKSWLCLHASKSCCMLPRSRYVIPLLFSLSLSPLSPPMWDAHTRKQEGRALIHFH